jgi:hypothetical protein
MLMDSAILLCTYGGRHTLVHQTNSTHLVTACRWRLCSSTARTTLCAVVWFSVHFKPRMDLSPAGVILVSLVCGMCHMHKIQTLCVCVCVCVCVCMRSGMCDIYKIQTLCAHTHLQVCAHILFSTLCTCIKLTFVAWALQLVVELNSSFDIFKASIKSIGPEVKEQVKRETFELTQSQLNQHYQSIQKMIESKVDQVPAHCLASNSVTSKCHEAHRALQIAS